MVVNAITDVVVTSHRLNVGHNEGERADEPKEPFPLRLVWFCLTVGQRVITNRRRGKRADGANEENGN